MNDAVVQVQAQWALHGKAPDSKGYRVLACSTGELGRENFADAVSRFTLGALDLLPQVSVSYLQHATRPGGSYLALARHWFARGDHRYGEGILPLDGHGRETAFTSYFCLPYREVAAAGATYLDLYEALSPVRLPVTDGPPREVTVTAAAARVPATDDSLATRVAALLLTGTPVCVLGAENTGVAVRLQFIDAVMALLPYGFRSRMSAATWTRPTQRDHRFRLYFAAVPRSAEQADHVVTWDEPDLAPACSGAAAEYLESLTDKLGPLARLRDLTPELGFGPKAATQALELLDGTRQRPPHRPPARRTERHADPQPGAERAERPPAAPPAPPAPGDQNEFVLADCAAHLRAENLAGLKSDIRWLANQAKTAELDAGRRRRYRLLIDRHGLLAPHPALKKQEADLCAALLGLAFGAPLYYEDYCRVERLAGVKPGAPLPDALLEAIERAGLGDPVIKAIVLEHPDGEKLRQWFDSGRVDVPQLVNLLSGGTWGHPAHAQILCDTVLLYLKQYRDRYDPGELRTALRQHGFLARALSLRHPDKEQYQFYALYNLLTAAYPQGLDRAAILQVLTGTPAPPTAALHATVLKLARPEDWELANDAYAYGSATLLGLDANTLQQLLRRVPDVRRADVVGDSSPAGTQDSCR